MSGGQVALSRLTRGTSSALSKATRQAVPPFLQKLYEMVSDSATDNLIQWSDRGDSFFVLDHERVAHDVFPRWFKHNNFASFVRQLNMYGFHKIPHLQQGVLRSESETEIWNFEHPNFHRGQPDLLCLITRKKQVADRQLDDSQSADKDGSHGSILGGLNANPLVDINIIINGIAAIKRHQATISADLNDLKASNQHLWQEALEARERHQRQQDMINRILKFLAGVFGNAGSPRNGPSVSGSAHHSIPRKRQRLMIEGGEDTTKQPSSSSRGSETPSMPNENVPIGRFVEVHQSSMTANPPSVISASEAPRTVPMDSTSCETPDSVITTAYGRSPNANFTGSGSIPSSELSSSILTPQPLHPVDPRTSTALTSPSQNMGTNQDILQAIANSPGQLQRLLSLLNSQQNVTVPTPLDLNSTDSDHVGNTANNVARSSVSMDKDLPDTQPQIASSFNIVEPDQQALSLLQPDEMSSVLFEPFIANNIQLQKTYRDASAISEDIDALQTSLDSLISNLGFDPARIPHDSEYSSHIDASFSQKPSHPEQPIPASHSSEMTTTPTSCPSDQQAHPLSARQESDSSSTELPDFDFNAFINELTRQQDVGSSTASTFGDSNGETLDTLIESDSTLTPPQLSVFVDEVASQSEVLSPSIRRASIPNDPLTLKQTDLIKKTRKRKSAEVTVSNQQAQSKTRQKR